MLLTRTNHQVLALTVAAMLLFHATQPVDAGLTSYLPSLSSLNPVSWVRWSRSGPANSTVSASSAASKLTNRSDQEARAGYDTAKLTTTPVPPTVETEPVKRSSNASRVHTSITTRAPVPTIPAASENITTATPAPATPTTKLGPIGKLFTTRKPRVITGRLTGPGRPMKVQIIKDGKIYETQISTNLSNLSTSHNLEYSHAFDSSSSDDSGNRKASTPVDNSGTKLENRETGTTANSTQEFRLNSTLLTLQPTNNTSAKYFYNTTNTAGGPSGFYSGARLVDSLWGWWSRGGTGPKP